ncbi:DUF1120 domain-containing protein [Pseudomonas sp. P7548]|uniref:DUF1120 domain-containing protein n=1 Tax=Pseudomonas sp. P7548 TaxID=2726981 RepID=UPI0015B8E6CD|nr:DUF1120 domain-containing protein [Pseudomonas sp. P7548]NWE19184.1 DUF1120 domain-containing protein [Pseudomonas sp. P7548]
MAAKAMCLGLLLWGGMMAQWARADECRLIVSQGRVDYGAIRNERRDERGAVAMGTRTVHLNILCPQPSTMALRFNGTASDSEGFRFGREGRFRLSLRHARLDGQPVEWADMGEPAAGQLLPGRTLVAQGAGRQLAAQVEIDADLPVDALRVRSHTVLEGQGHFELVSPPVPRSQ